MFMMSVATQAQNIYVVKNIKGIIKNGEKGLKIGDSINESSILTFDKEALMCLSSTSIKQWMLSSYMPNIQVNKKYVLKDLLPTTSESTAFQPLEDSLSFQNHFGNKIFRVYGDNYSVRVASSYHVMYTNEQSDRYFLFKMKYENKEFYQYLQGTKNHLYFRKKDIFQRENKTLKSENTQFLGLFFFQKDKNTYTQLADFQISFVDDGKLLEKVKPLIDMIDKGKLDKISYTIFCNQIKMIADEMYGKVEKDNITYWLERKLYVYKPLSKN